MAETLAVKGLTSESTVYWRSGIQLEIKCFGMKVKKLIKNGLFLTAYKTVLTILSCTKVSMKYF